MKGGSWNGSDGGDSTGNDPHERAMLFIWKAEGLNIEAVSMLSIVVTTEVIATFEVFVNERRVFIPC